MSRTTKKVKKYKWILTISFITIIIICIIAGFIVRNNQLQNEMLRKEKLKEEILNHYNEYVVTNKNSEIYTLNNSKYQKSGKIVKGQELILEPKDITYEDEYLKVKTFDNEYYIYYKDVDIIETMNLSDNRYKRYILFNKNVVTANTTNFYDEEGNLIYTLNQSFNLPIIVNKENIYGVEFNNRLLYVKKEDISEVIDSQNTKLTNTNGIAVLNYHFFYDESKQTERDDCNQYICKSKTGFKQHLDYIKNNNIFTPTMKEFEMYLNKEINLPKSTLITIDDGWRMQIGVDLLEEYQLNATVFLITSWWEEINFLNKYKYVEYHSHGDNLHNQGVCPGGQGGAIKCLDKKTLLEDLSLSRKKLNGTTIFCYPFYEYNNYSISVLKEAGFTLAFVGGMKKATLSSDKYQIPRYVMYDQTTVEQLKSYID